MELEFSNTIPLIVIRHSVPDIFHGLLPQDSIIAEEEWKNSQEKVSALSLNGQVWVAEKSGHNIHIEQPEIVIEAIKILLNNF